MPKKRDLTPYLRVFWNDVADYLMTLHGVSGKSTPKKIRKTLACLDLVKSVVLSKYKSKRACVLRWLEKAGHLTFVRGTTYMFNPTDTFLNSKEFADETTIDQLIPAYRQKVQCAALYAAQSYFDRDDLVTPVREVPDALHLFWHIDEYDCIRNSRTSISRAFPKALKKEIDVSLAKGIFPKVFPLILQKWINEHIGLAGTLESIPVIPDKILSADKDTGVIPHNEVSGSVLYTPIIRGTVAYINRYKIFIDKLNERAMKFAALVEEYGGEEAFVRHVFEDVIKEIVLEAPMHLNAPKWEDTSWEVEWTNELVSFILNNPELFTKENLFPEGLDKVLVPEGCFEEEMKELDDCIKVLDGIPVEEDDE